jgi:hypothetical protein
MGTVLNMKLVCLTSMKKGEIVGYISIDVNSRCDDLFLMMNCHR